jgi:hypothetical protein
LTREMARLRPIMPSVSPKESFEQTDTNEG